MAEQGRVAFQTLSQRSVLERQVAASGEHVAPSFKRLALLVRQAALPRATSSGFRLTSGALFQALSGVSRPSCAPPPRLIQFFRSGQLKQISAQRCTNRHRAPLQGQLSPFRRDESATGAKIELGAHDQLRDKDETCRSYCGSLRCCGCLCCCGCLRFRIIAFDANGRTMGKRGFSTGSRVQAKKKRTAWPILNTRCSNWRTLRSVQRAVTTPKRWVRGARHVKAGGWPVA